MTTYCVGCDNIVGGEKNIIHKVAKVLEDAGNTCEELNVGPNFVQSKGLSGSSKGKVAVFIVGGSDIGTYVDFRDGLNNGYYHYKYIWFAFCSWTAKTWITGEDLKNKPLVRAHDDNFSSQSSIAPYLGKSADYFFSKNKGKMNYVYGQSPEELAKKILGEGVEGDDKNKSNERGEIKSAIKDVLYNWDGDVECFIRDDTVYIKKIPSPTDAKLSLVEGVNIDLGSVSVTDYNPSTINILTTSFEDYDLTIQDDYLIKRFGKIPSTVEMDKEITTLKDAKKFLQREWNKLKRENGHSLELKTYGDSNWRQGEWCRVYLPSFNIDDYMYITKVSQEDSGEWNCNLTLVDYPPGFGEPAKTGNEEGNESEDTNDANENTIDTQTAEGIT